MPNNLVNDLRNYLITKGTSFEKDQALQSLLKRVSDTVHVETHLKHILTTLEKITDGPLEPDPECDTLTEILERIEELNATKESETRWADHYARKLMDLQRMGCLPEDFTF